MFPILFQVGSVKIVTLPVVLLIGVFFGIFLFWREAKREYFAEIEIFDLSFILILGMIFGGKILVFLSSILQFGLTLAFFRIWDDFGAFSFWGAILGAVVAAWLYSNNKDWRFFRILDFGAFAFLGSLVLVWLGNFLAGTAYGATTNLAWGIFSPYLLGRRHPVQVLAIFGFILIYFVLKWLSRRVHFEGYFFSWFLVFSSLLLFFLEFLRGDSVYLFTVRVNQIFAVVFFVTGLGLFYRRAKRNIFSDIVGFLVLVFKAIIKVFKFTKGAIFNIRLSLKYKILSIRRRNY